MQLSSSGLKTKCCEIQARMLYNVCAPGDTMLIKSLEARNVECRGIRNPVILPFFYLLINVPPIF